MTSSRLRSIFAATALLSAATCRPMLEPADYLQRNPSAQRIDVRCHPGEVAEHITIWARDSVTKKIVTNEDDMELRLFMPNATALFVLDRHAPDPEGDAAREMYWSCPAPERYFPASAELLRAHPCPAEVSQNEERPDPRLLAQPANATPKCDPPRPKPTTIRVCVRPPGAPDTMNQWAAVPKKEKNKVEPPRWKLPRADYDAESAKAVVHFVLDETAPGETAYYFSKQFPNLRCPGKEKLKPLAEVLGDGAYSRLGEFVEDGTGTGPGQTNTTTTTTTTTRRKGDGKTTETSSPDGKGPPLSVFEAIARNLAVGGALAQGDTSGNLKDPNGHRSGIPGGKNVGGFSFPPLQAGVALLQILTSAGLSPKSFIDDILKFAKRGQRTLIKEADEKMMRVADELIAKSGRYEMAQGLQEMQTIMPYELGEKFTKDLGGKFQAHKIFEKQALEKVLKRSDFEKLPSVILTDKEHQAISVALEAEWRKVGKGRMTIEKLRQIYKDVYKDHPHWLDAIESYLR